MPKQVILRFRGEMLMLGPKERITPFEWIIEGLPPKVLLHHQRMLGLIPNND